MAVDDQGGAAAGETGFEAGQGRLAATAATAGEGDQRPGRERAERRHRHNPDQSDALDGSDCGRVEGCREGEIGTRSRRSTDFGQSPRQAQAGGRPDGLLGACATLSDPPQPCPAHRRHDVGVLLATGSSSAAVTCPNSVPVVSENNCKGEGSSGWLFDNYDESIAGFATQTSFNVGQSVPLKIARDTPTPADQSQHRTSSGWATTAVKADASSTPPPTSPSPTTSPANRRTPTTGELSCANWSVTHTVPAAAVPTTGVYDHITRSKASTTGPPIPVRVPHCRDECVPQARPLRGDASVRAHALAHVLHGGLLQPGEEPDQVLWVVGALEADALAVAQVRLHRAQHRARRGPPAPGRRRSPRTPSRGRARRSGAKPVPPSSAGPFRPPACALASSFAPVGASRQAAVRRDGLRSRPARSSGSCACIRLRKAAEKLGASLIALAGASKARRIHSAKPSRASPRVGS